MGRQIADGLEAAHEAGVVHRDLKPANVCITHDGVVKLLDFGLAKPMLQNSSSNSVTTKPDSLVVTQEGTLIGTPAYMSPEQARAKRVDRRTDIWAFGCVLYECLAGRRAFTGESLPDVMAAILGSEPDWSALPAGTPAYLRSLLRRCLDKDARTRLRDMGEARVALILGGDRREVDQAAPILAGRTGWRRPVPAVVGLALGAVATLFLVRSCGPAGPPPNPLEGAT